MIRYTSSMRRVVLLVLALLVAVSPLASAAPQSRNRKAPPKKAAAKPAPGRLITAPADVTCPQVLGKGVGSQLVFCDVMTGRNPAEGIVVKFPPHKGPLTLSFDLHNRHTYSEDRIRAGRGYTAYTATIGVLAMDGTLLTRAVVQNEFRTSRDLLDRVGGGAGPGGVKAVAPTGTERIRLAIPDSLDAVGILGEKLTVVTMDGTETYGALQRPIAVISNVKVEYVPGKKPATKAPAKRK